MGDKGGQRDGGWVLSACHMGAKWRAMFLCPTPTQATCQAVGGGQRVCTCPPGYGGDGFSCYGDIFRVSGSLCQGRGPLMHLRWEGAVQRSLRGGGWGGA